MNQNWNQFWGKRWRQINFEVLIVFSFDQNIVHLFKQTIAFLQLFLKGNELPIFYENFSIFSIVAIQLVFDSIKTSI